MRGILLICANLLVIGCSSTVTQQLTPTITYIKDMPFTVNGRVFTGTGTVPQATSYKIEFDYPYGKVSLFTFQTCHRDVKFETSSNKFVYVFVPSQIELDNSCMLEIGAYTLKGKDSWGVLLFERKDAALPATTYCNGQTSDSLGVSICQSKIGTLQRIAFPVAVKVASDCKITALDVTNKTWEYEVTKGFCYFLFRDTAQRFQKHTAYGYQTFIIRE